VSARTTGGSHELVGAPIYGAMRNSGEEGFAAAFLGRRNLGGVLSFVRTDAVELRLRNNWRAFCPDPVLLREGIAELVLRAGWKAPGIT